MDSSELTMIVSKTKSARMSPEAIRLQAGEEIRTLYRMLPIKNKHARLHFAKRLVRALLNSSYRNIKPGHRQTLMRLGSEVIDQPGRSYTSVPSVNSNSQNVSPKPQSKYQSLEECVQNYVQNGYSSDAARKLCLEFFPPGPDFKGGRNQITPYWREGRTNFQKRFSSMYRHIPAHEVNSYVQNLYGSSSFYGVEDINSIKTSTGRTRSASLTKPAWLVCNERLRERVPIR